MRKGETMVYDVVIAGAGVVGAMTARELTRYRLSVCLLEKENDVAMGASKANSGIIHGGFDPLPGTLKAKLNVQGIPLLFRAAEELAVPYRKNGSLVVAFGKEEEPTIDMLYRRGMQNGVTGQQILTGEEARALEPALSRDVTRALRVPGSGIISPYELAIAATGNAMDNGATLIRNFEVAAICRKGGVFTVSSSGGASVQCRYFVNCAGGYADRIAAMAGDDFFRVIPRAGEYLLLDKNEGRTGFHTVFQIPTKEGKGILVTPTADGNLLLGPTASRVDSPAGTETTAAGLSKVAELAKKSIPGVNTRAVITSFTGVRASTEGGDFLLRRSERVPGLIHAAGIDSPGLSACAAIAAYLVGLLRKSGLTAEENPDFNGKRRDMHAFRKMNEEEKDAFIRRNPAYGRIVCRCETVSEGEILEALRQEPRALDTDGVKRRTRAGMGRCQGGFCLPRVAELIAEETQKPMAEITKKGGRSVLTEGEL